ncbi:membrane protein insertase YidC, partial [Mycobacterium asiaticum]
FSLRALLYKPFVRQIRTTRQMQELQLLHLERHALTVLAVLLLQREHGFNPILGCLPMLAQIPVFLGLYHVLRSFNRTTGGIGLQQMSVAQNKLIGNYVFTPADVQNFLKANLFGAPIGASMTQGGGLDAFEHFSRPAVIAVGVPVMILAGVATYFNSRASVARQSPEAAANPQTAMMNKLALYVFPLGVVVGGPFLPLAIILYWFANNIWTFGQQHYVFGMIEKEDEAKKQEVLQRRAANAPAPGAKPKRTPKTGPAAAAEGDTGGTETSDVEDGATDDKPAKGTPAPKPSPGNRNSGPGRTPRPGARPKKRKR